MEQSAARRGPIFAEGASGRSRPRSLIAAISEIQELAVVEKLGTPLPEHLILLDRSFAYTEVGVHSVVVDGLINMLGVPMGLGVLGSLMPIFGDPDPSLFDQVFAQLIGITYGVGYAVMIGHYLGSCYIGKVCKRAIQDIYQSMIVANIIKVILLSVFFNFMYQLLTPEHVEEGFKVLWPLLRGVMSDQMAVGVQYWVISTREVMIPSATVVILVTIATLCVPYVYFVIGGREAAEEKRRNRLYDVC